jgi:hypothetical protein
MNKAGSTPTPPTPKATYNTRKAWPAQIIGACCGSTPEHIRKLKQGWMPLQPVGNRAGNRHEYLLNQVFCVGCLKATDRSDVENDRTINRRELIPCRHVFRVLKTQNQAGSGSLVSPFHEFVE